MNSIDNQPERYRLVFYVGDRGQIYADREYPSDRAAHAEAADAAREAPEHAVDAVVLQRGTSGDQLRYDARRIIPGERGGWSDAHWEDVSSWNANTPPPAVRRTHVDSGAVWNARRGVAILATAAVCLFATMTIFAMQTGAPSHDPAVAGGRHSQSLSELPITAVGSDVPSPGGPGDSSLAASLKAAMSATDTNEPVADGRSVASDAESDLRSVALGRD